MKKLSAYTSQYVILYTADGTRLLCRPISMEKENNNNYIVDIIEPSGKYEQGQVIISEDEVGDIIELPKEVQQGIELTLKSAPALRDFHQKSVNKDLPSRVEFGIIKNGNE